MTILCLCWHPQAALLIRMVAQFPDMVQRLEAV